MQLAPNSGGKMLPAFWPELPHAAAREYQSHTARTDNFTNSSNGYSQDSGRNPLSLPAGEQKFVILATVEGE